MLFHSTPRGNHKRKTLHNQRKYFSTKHGCHPNTRMNIQETTWKKDDEEEQEKNNKKRVE